MSRAAACGLLAGIAVLAAAASHGYPLYGAEDRGIRRLEGARLAHEAVVAGPARLPGELLRLDEVALRLADRPDFTLPPPDPAFTAEIRSLLGAEADRYGICVLDLSDRAAPRYAEHRGDALQNPGSVGKVVVATGVLQALADAYPDDLAARERVLRETVVTADEFIRTDSHKVRLWDPAARRLTRRPLAVGDEGTLWEYLDWMLSASSNAAAAMVMQQAMLLTRFGREYPLPPAEAAGFFERTPRDELRDLLARSMQEPLTRNGLDVERLRQGSFFTRRGKQKVPGTTSVSTPRELMRFLVRLEQGRIVDAFSSRELKRLLYMTERRIRYASSPALRDSAVYFKSGSWYQCVPEEGFTCRKYHGNKRNLMHSVAIVESPAGEATLYYLVTLTSNVLRRNSAVDHQTLATRIHRLIAAAHGHDGEGG